MSAEDDERRAKNAEKQRKWRAANRDRARKQARENAKRWRAENPERAREIRRTSDQKRRNEQPDLIREQDRERMSVWRAANPERNLENDRRWREENPEKSREKQQRYVEAHPDKVAERNAAYSETKKERRQNDPEWAQEQRDRAIKWAEQNPEKRMDSYKNRRKQFPNVLRDQLMNARNRAREAGIDFDDALFNQITSDTVPPCCQACDAEFEVLEPQPGGGRRINLRALSFDRVDNTKGYFLANIGFLCYECNAFKKNATVAKLKAIVAYMERHFARHQ